VVFIIIVIIIFIYLLICLFTYKFENKIILRDFLNLNLTISKTKYFCEFSLIFEISKLKTKQFYETYFKNGNLSAELTASCQYVLRFFHSIYLKYFTFHQIIWNIGIQNYLNKFEILMLQNTILLRKSAPGPPNNSDKYVSCTAPATEHTSL
jgi:hypothetical protein